MVSVAYNGVHGRQTHQVRCDKRSRVYHVIILVTNSAPTPTGSRSFPSTRLEDSQTGSSVPARNAISFDVYRSCDSLCLYLFVIHFYCDLLRGWVLRMKATSAVFTNRSDLMIALLIETSNLIIHDDYQFHQGRRLWPLGMIQGHPRLYISNVERPTSMQTRC
ncbi:hypothetical protein BJY01DRAFT_122473 [Aspergillus pseudoustus]|uniref:Uncharacterized protein n=1 Tax=Aspergillus pseudoustus TaxID=1810923 RepID=A0ABR4IQJ3_9EURO